VFIYGYHPVREALRRRPAEVLRILVSSSRRGGRRREIEELCRRRRLEFEVMESEDLDSLAGKGHNGFAAELKQAPEETAREGVADLVVLLEDVQDPRNLGALLRVCEGTGVGRVLIRDRGSAPLSPTVAKTSAGASEWLGVERIPNPARALRQLKEEGYWIYGLVPGGRPPWELDLAGRVVLCLGGEQKGLRSLTRKRCDDLVGLPMRGRVESLNVATAAAAVLYEVVRQRETRQRRR
jgi:23S rRNA (guanosine2251-2'-O)-methyltransferase